MAENVTNELLLETLRAIQMRLGNIEAEMRIMRTEVAGIQTQIAGIHTECAGINTAIASNSLRIDRVE